MITRIYVKCDGEWVKCTDLAHGDSKAPERHNPRQETGTGLPTSTISCAGTQVLRPTHTAPNHSKLGPTSSDSPPHVSLAQQHDHCLFLEKLSWMFYLLSYSQKWSDLREKLWEGHIRVLWALVHNTGTQYTHTPDTDSTAVSRQTHTSPRTHSTLRQ